MSKNIAPPTKYDPDKIAVALLGLSGDLRKLGTPELKAVSERLYRQVKAAEVKR